MNKYNLKATDNTKMTREMVQKKLTEVLHTTHRWAWANEGEHLPFELKDGKDIWCVIPGSGYEDGTPKFYSHAWNVTIFHDWIGDKGWTTEIRSGCPEYAIKGWMDARDSYQKDSFEAICAIKHDIEKGDFIKDKYLPAILHKDEDPEKCWTLNLIRDTKNVRCDWVIYHNGNEIHMDNDPWKCADWSRIAHDTITAK